MELLKPLLVYSQLHDGVTFLALVISKLHSCLLPLVASDLVSEDRSLLSMNTAYHDRLGHAPKHLPEEEDSRDLDVTGNVHEDSSKRCDQSSRVRIIP